MPLQAMQADPAQIVREASARVDRALTVDSYAQLLRAEGDEILARHGYEIRQNVVHRIAEIEAA